MNINSKNLDSNENSIEKNSNQNTFKTRKILFKKWSKRRKCFVTYERRLTKCEFCEYSSVNRQRFE